jgi:phosphopantothenoylcysteine decarboxylase/phosphopantothenate--cysteine ligase
MRDTMRKVAADADAVVMTAAVADFRPASEAPHKIKKSDAGPPPIPLEENPDILLELVASRRPGQIVVGFAAETGDDNGTVLEHGRTKLHRKGCDLLVVNAVGAGKAFGQLGNAGVILGADGSEVGVPFGPKALLAASLWDAVVSRLTA